MSPITPRVDVQTGAADIDAPIGTAKSAAPPITIQIAESVSQAALRRLEMDDNPDHFIVWLETFSP